MQSRVRCHLPMLGSAALVRRLSTAAPRLRVLKSTSTNAAFNLATEEYIFERMEPDSHVLFLWQNDRTVVLGKHQNAWQECNLDNMEADGVHLVRRKSGGAFANPGRCRPSHRRT